MRSTHRFRDKAPIDSIYRLISSERWLSFVPGYLGLESGDPKWPNEGSSIVVRFWLGPWTARFEVTVVEHEYGRRFLTHEEAFSGRYIDDASFTFQADDGTTRITFIRDVTSKSFSVGILLLLVFPLRWVTARYVKRRIKASCTVPART